MADDCDKLTNLARQILRDRYRVGAFYNSLFTVHDWVSAAEFALEGDYDDLRYMLAKDEEPEEDGFSASDLGLARKLTSYMALGYQAVLAQREADRGAA